MTKERVIEALGLLDQAITADRHYAPALSWAAICHMQLVRDGWTEEPETSHQTGINLARRAIEVGENDPQVLANAAVVLAWFGEGIGAMIGLIDRATGAQLELPPRVVSYKRLTENELSDFSRLCQDGCGQTITEVQDVDRNHSAEV
jgi:hypothetical protein